MSAKYTKEMYSQLEITHGKYYGFMFSAFEKLADRATSPHRYFSALPLSGIRSDQSALLASMRLGDCMDKYTHIMVTTAYLRLPLIIISLRFIINKDYF